MKSEIPQSLYSQIHEVMPILCVDVVVTNGSDILLVCRDCEPEKGTWWFPGGRLHKGERLKTGARRIVKQETNLNVSAPLFLGIAETQFTTDPFGHKKGTHTVNAVYLARPSETAIFSVILDDNHIAHRWVEISDVYSGDFHPYIKRYVAMAEGAIKG